LCSTVYTPWIMISVPLHHPQYPNSLKIDLQVWNLVWVILVHPLNQYWYWAPPQIFNWVRSRPSSWSIMSNKYFLVPKIHKSPLRLSVEIFFLKHFNILPNYAYNCVLMLRPLPFMIIFVIINFFVNIFIIIKIYFRMNAESSKAHPCNVWYALHIFKAKSLGVSNFGFISYSYC